MIAWAIETLSASTLLMLVVLAIRRPVARYFGPHIAYGLWLLPALRMLLPPLPEEVAPTPLHMLPSPLDIQMLLMLPAAPVAESAVDWPLLLGALWGAGAIAFLAWHIHRYRSFVRAALGDATQLPRFDRDGVEVCASPAARGPFAAGIFMKTIVLPEDYRRRYARDELRLAIEHEVQHHRRCDMSANFAALFVLALHWWNPIAHFAHRAFRIDQELACDAIVLADATPAERHAYGSALLKSACDRLPVAACALGAGDDLKRRLTMMKTYRWNPARARLGSLIGTALIGSGLLLTASNGIAAETSRKVEERVRTLVPVLAPVPPAPPALVAPPAAPRAPAAPLVPPPPKPPVAPSHDEVADAHADGNDHGDKTETAFVDHDEIAREVDAELRRELPRVQAEIRQAQIELRRELPKVHLEVARAQAEAHAGAGACNGAAKMVMKISHGGDAHMIQCRGWSAVDRETIRKTVIASLESARAGIAAMNHHGAGRDRALESLDRKLAELRAAH